MNNIKIVGVITTMIIIWIACIGMLTQCLQENSKHPKGNNVSKQLHPPVHQSMDTARNMHRCDHRSGETQ